jgi:hypothetical protein
VVLEESPGNIPGDEKMKGAWGLHYPTGIARNPKEISSSLDFLALLHS